MIEASWIAFAFVLGLVARSIGLPPLIGYLDSGKLPDTDVYCPA